VENRRRITEDDLLATEALIAESYSRLKQSVIQAPSRTFRSVGQTIKEHPVETAAAATVVGLIAYGLIRAMKPRVVYDKVQEPAHAPVKKGGYPDLVKEILSVMLPLATPYIAGYIQKYMSEIHHKKRD